MIEAIGSAIISHGIIETIRKWWGKFFASNRWPPTFRDLRGEGDSRPGRATFLRLRFADQVTTYVWQEAVSNAFADFNSDEAPFLWWLIAGGAGTGKSRTALEFCEALKEQGWQAGFVDMEKTDPEVWHRWQPKQNTLLVIDYVAREFARAADDPRHLSSIFNTLLRRVQRNELGSHRLRLLLLERATGQDASWFKDLEQFSFNFLHMESKLSS